MQIFGMRCAGKILFRPQGSKTTNLSVVALTWFDAFKYQSLTKSDWQQ
jgi:hypothetical protein